MLLDNDYRDVKDGNGNVLYRIKECFDEFPYTITDTNGRKRTVSLQEKRVVTYNPKLASKQLFEINRLIEKARALKASQAKKSEFGECARYVTFVSADKKGNETDGLVKAVLNEDAIRKSKQLAGYNLLVTSEISMKATDIVSVYHNLWRIEESCQCGYSKSASLLSRIVQQCAGNPSQQLRCYFSGSLNKTTTSRVKPVPTDFLMGQVEKELSNPLKQAEYLYSLIRPEVITSGTK